MGIREYPDKRRVYLDMDGPLANFEDAMDFYGEPAKVVKLIPGVYAKLPPTKGSVDAVQTIIHDLDFDLMVLTKVPDKNPYAAAEKLMWIDQWHPDLHGRVIISPDKGCIGTKRDILIDDHPEWANASKFPGTIIHFLSPEFPDWTTTLMHLYWLRQNP